MARIRVPRVKERSKARLKNFNLTLIDSIDEKELEEEIVEYLSQHNVLHLATCRNDKPRSTPLEHLLRCSRPWEPSTDASSGNYLLTKR